MPRVFSEIPTPSVAQVFRFWAKVKRGPGCWEWQGATRSSLGRSLPYGGFRLSRTGTPYAAHRLVYTLTGNEIPPGKLVLHSCDNPRCVKPTHLFLGTDLDNNRDKAAKGRHHAQKITHCPRGHPYSEENTYHYKGSRNCRLCRRETGRRYRERQKCAELAN